MKNRRIQLVVALALVGALATVAYAAVLQQTIKGKLLVTSAIASPAVYDLYSASAGTGHRTRTFAVTLSSGTNTVNFGSGIEPVGCVAYYNQSTVRSFAINLGHVAAQRTMTIKLGGGGTTNDAVAGTCRTVETY